MAEQPVVTAPAAGRGREGGLSSLERFAAWLRERELPATPQRLVIADILLSSSSQLSAEEIVHELLRRDVRVGLATVYRTLDVLVQSGLVVERDLGEGFLRFEPARDEPLHEQLHCTSCDRIEEFHDEGLEPLLARVAGQHGFARERHHFVIHGLCRDCRAVGERTAS
ncbi:MAG: Fur family transcriptional regulator [Gemmatimonadales bacterium]